ncbi:hypothetical protein ACFQU7_07820 [Pseudoroseomonas wenyumeiae]
MSGLWGVYNGFELCEATPLAPGKEEYLDSEKYEIRIWDHDRPGNIVPEITALNRIRRENPALHTHLGTTILNAQHDGILLFLKQTPEGRTRSWSPSPWTRAMPWKAGSSCRNGPWACRAVRPCMSRT